MAIVKHILWLADWCLIMAMLLPILAVILVWGGVLCRHDSVAKLMRWTENWSHNRLRYLDETYPFKKA